MHDHKGGHMARRTHIAPVLTLHRGGVDPEELRRAQNEAARALAELADVMPASDGLQEAVVALSRSLRLRESRAQLQAMIARVGA